MLQIWRAVGLQDSAGLGVENRDNLWATHLQDGGSMRFRIRVERDGLCAGRDAQIDLRSGRGDDLAVTDDPWLGQGRRVVRPIRQVLVRAYLVGREQHRLTQKRRNAQPCGQEAGEQMQGVHARTLARGFPHT